jgi:hypothetical protein
MAFGIGKAAFTLIKFEWLYYSEKDGTLRGDRYYYFFACSANTYGF